MLSFDILHETQHWLAVNKPCGLNVEQLWDYPSVESAVKKHLQGSHKKEPYLGIVHRLDRPVSGVLLLAKKKQPLKLLNEQFAKKEVIKTYWAIVEARPPNEQGILNHYLIKNQKAKRAFAYDTPKKNAILGTLTYKTLQIKDGLCLLEIHPKNGRFHQIRVQLAAINCPILGDYKYGATQKYSKNGIALHAQSISFVAPGTEKRHAITAKPPGHSVWGISNM